MSRVFLAEEARLRRTVVIKVLPPELGAGVNVARFEQEIALAAKLQDPHIVPLLTAGATGDLLYYIMPHIAGESLRARLAHERELPIADTLHILHDVLDGLAYAHSHHVVHRDIKPDNVLLSGRHALVTDFGVAKAVQESTGATVLTSVGVALGTPAYMAPEQATADPNTDHRADLYAVGALAYEMLTGRPPFTAPTAQGVLAAHVTAPPDPVTKYRDSVPPALAALVMRCLAKHPADRWQSASEMLTELEHLMSPPSGSSADAAVAARRGRPLHVAAWFVAASAGVLALVYLLRQILGLRDWVLRAAAVLLAAGLPIMIATGLFERRRALARSAGRITATTAGGWHRLFTWRRAISGGVAAFAALGLGAVAVGDNAPDDSGIIAAADRLSRGMRERMGESLRTIRSSEALEQLTTGSLEALRRYSEALRAADRGEFTRAVELLGDAIALDSGFAMAYRKLAVIFSNMGESPSRTKAAAASAFRYRERLPALERHLATA